MSGHKKKWNGKKGWEKESEKEKKNEVAVAAAEAEVERGEEEEGVGRGQGPVPDRDQVLSLVRRATGRLPAALDPGPALPPRKNAVNHRDGLRQDRAQDLEARSPW